MESLNIQLQPFFEWLLRTTVQASVLIALILLVQLILRGKLGIRWCYFLWLVLLIRMAMPWAPQSRVSMFNLIPQPVPQRQTEYARTEVSDDTVESDVAEKATSESEPVSKTDAPKETAEPITVTPVMREGAGSQSKSAFLEVADVLPWIWLSGALVLAVYVCAGNFNLWWLVTRERPLTDQDILDLLEDCKSQMGIRTIMGVVITDKVKSPALFGFIRPRLLLPKGMLETLSREELRYVFLHELAHLKRHDIYIGWLMSLLQVLHWFNPLIWLAFYRMRADRELACDALVLARLMSGGLARTQPGQAKDYGRTIVSLLERFSRSQRLPAMAGILETKAQLKRRITMIAQFKKDSYRWSPLAVLLIVVISCIALPDAVGSKKSGVSWPESEPSISLRRVGYWASVWATISPDGKYFCDAWYGKPNYALMVRELATGKEEFLVPRAHPRDHARNPLAISPDSKTVAYRWHDGKEETYQLQLINLDGSQRRTIQTGQNIIPKDWSPDGKRLLGVRSMDDFWVSEFLWVSVEDGSVQSITEVPKGRLPMFNEVDLSPDGGFIAYTAEFPQPNGMPERDIFIFSIENGRDVRIEHHAQERLLGWTPGGKYILFRSNRTGEDDAWLLQVADGKPQGRPRLVYKNIGKVAAPAGFTQSGDYYYGTRWPTGNVYTVGVDLKQGKPLCEPEPVNPGLYGCAAWSPDGQYLAYYAEGAKNIHIRSLATGDERVLDPNLPIIGRLAWSPDGRSLLASRFRVRWLQKGLGPSVCQIDIKTGQSGVLVQSEVGQIRRAELSPDQKSLFYTAGRSLLVRNLETGQEEEICEYGPASWAPWTPPSCWDLSPDGKRLVIVAPDPNSSSQLKIISVEGKELGNLLPQNWEPPHDEHCGFRHVSWTPDGQSVLFSIQRDYHHAVLWQISAKGGEPREILTTPKLGYWPSGFSVHPDGKRIAFAALGVDAGLWVMENFLPPEGK